LVRAFSNGELENHYRPKVEIASGVLTEVETLVRWRHGTSWSSRTGSSPRRRNAASFDELARAVLIGALPQARLCQDAGLELKVAVTLSMDYLGALDFPDFVMRAARDAQVSPTKLVLEVTESRLTKDPVAPLDILTRLRLKGVGLSIHGHSSLAQLRDIPK
jgi:EAL domain-containing protein (putative c-di-GMP-specific phosphodiesterase class I)